MHRHPAKNMKVKTSFVLLFLFALSLISCDANRIYDENKAIPEAYWEKDFRPAFTVPVEDSTTNYRFYINVRHTNEYRFSNLYVFLKTHFPNGNTTQDTIECMLADLDGRWLGRGSGKIVEHQILLNPALRFPLNGSYIFEIEQAMREPLEGIKDIGIRIEKSE
jgi:gliding motility-associated lipoprotein GldH